MFRIYGFHRGLCCWCSLCFTQHITSHYELCQEKRKWSHCLLENPAYAVTLQWKTWLCKYSSVMCSWRLLRLVLGKGGGTWGVPVREEDVIKLEVTHKPRLWPVTEAGLWTDIGWFFSRPLDLLCSWVIQREILQGQRLIPGFCVSLNS